MNRSVVAALLLLLSFSCNSESIMILPNSANADFLRISNTTRSQCVTDKVGFVVEREGTVLRAYGQNRKNCPLPRDPYVDQFLLVDRCVGPQPCDGAITSVEVRVLNIEECAITPASIPDCARAAPALNVSYEPVIFFKAPTHQSIKFSNQGFALERRGLDSLSIDIIDSATGYRLSFEGADSLYSVLGNDEQPDIRLFRLDGLYSTLLDFNGNLVPLFFKHTDGRFVVGNGANNPNIVDALWARGSFAIIDEKIKSRSFVIESCSLPVEGSEEVSCRLSVDHASVGAVQCDRNRTCSLSIGGSVIAMRLEQFGYDAWFGATKIDSDSPCCTYFREAFAVRTR